MDLTTLIIGLAVGLVAGLICQYLINKFGLKSKRERIINDAHKEAEVIKKNKLLEEKKPWLKNRRCKRSWVTRRQRDPDNLSAKKGAATKAANAAKKGFYFTPESRQRMSVAHKGITKLMRAAMIRQREKDALARKMGMV